MASAMLTGSSSFYCRRLIARARAASRCCASDRTSREARAVRANEIIGSDYG